MSGMKIKSTAFLILVTLLSIDYNRLVKYSWKSKLPPIFNKERHIIVTFLNQSGSGYYNNWVILMVYTMLIVLFYGFQYLTFFDVQIRYRLGEHSFYTHENTI